MTARAEEAAPPPDSLLLPMFEILSPADAVVAFSDAERFRWRTEVGRRNCRHYCNVVSFYNVWRTTTEEDEMVCQHSIEITAPATVVAGWQVQLGRLNVELSEEPIRDDICQRRGERKSASLSEGKREWSLRDRKHECMSHRA